VPASSLAAAEAVVPFDVYLPKGPLSDPVAIYTTDSGTPRADAVIEFVFDTSTYGRVVVFERRPEVPATDYDATIEETAKNYAGNGVAEIHTIRGGIKGLLESFDGDSGFGIYWLENGVEFWLGGPNLSSDDILAIADGI